MSGETGWTPLDWETLDWAALDRLRERFLKAAPGADYWSSPADLANYDFTYGQRIAWKWDAVMRELQSRRWVPPARSLLDWGCGSGVAGRRVIEWIGADRVDTLRLFDRSELAVEFSVRTGRAAFPGVRVERADAPGENAPGEVGILVVSHVFNELSPPQRETLLRLAARAQAVLWVEPGTHADSRQLIAVREALRGDFTVLAPCTHQAGCGLLTAENARHWCHHFAAPPAGIMADSRWVQFAQRAGIDLRSLPYSFLVLEKAGVRAEPSGLVPVEGAERVLGVPRLSKPYARVIRCGSEGVRERVILKRDQPELYRQLKRGECPPMLPRDQ